MKENHDHLTFGSHSTNSESDDLGWV